MARGSETIPRMYRRAMLAAVALALAHALAALAPSAASGALVYQRGASRYDHPVRGQRAQRRHAPPRARARLRADAVAGREVVAYFKGDSAESLWVEPVRGGSARRLLGSTSDSGSPIAWSPDGRRLVVARASGAYLVGLDGTKRVLTESYLFSAASFSPDGRRVAVDKDLECDSCFGDLFAYRVDAPGERSLGRGWGPAWGRLGLAFGRNEGVLLRPRVGVRAHVLLHSHRRGNRPDWVH